MKTLLAVVGKFFGAVAACGIAIAVVSALSWIITCGIVALVCLCFGWAFKWGIATGIWLILLLAKWIFDRGSK